MIGSRFIRAAGWPGDAGLWLLAIAAFAAMGCKGDGESRGEKLGGAREDARSAAAPDRTLREQRARRDDAAAQPDPRRPASLLDEMRALGTASGDRAAAEELHSQALKIHRRGEYGDAEVTWARAARADPSWERPFYNLACATAKQGRTDDAMAYLRMVTRREIDLSRLLRLEEDPDLASLRDTAPFGEVVTLLAEQLLVATYWPAGNPTLLPAGRAPATSCQRFTLDPRGAFTHRCQGEYETRGQWTYSSGVLHLHVTRHRAGCEAGEPCPAFEIDDYAALGVAVLDERFLCLEPIEPPPWPGRRRGRTARAPRGTIAPGCYE